MARGVEPRRIDEHGWRRYGDRVRALTSNAGSNATDRLLDDDVFRRLNRAREYLREHHADAITLEHAARQAGISRFHFLRSFHRAFGTTPHDYLTSVRIERAKDLLARRGASVTHACFEVGFSSLGSFSALFSRRVGAPPSAWQREMRVAAQVPADLAQRLVPWCFAIGFGDF